MPCNEQGELGSMNDAEFADLKARMDADCDRVSADVARVREKKAATKKPRRVSLKKYMASENCTTKKRGPQ
jgi:hypothetical protein